MKRLLDGVLAQIQFSRDLGLRFSTGFSRSSFSQDFFVAMRRLAVL
jgi:hypothetical protein